VNWAEKETGGEAFIPLATSKRARSMAIWERTGQLLGAYNGGIKMAQGGLVDADTSHADGNWHPKTAQLQIDTEAAATQFGEIAMQAIGKISNDKLAEVANAKLDAVRSVMSAAGPGYSIGGNWAPNVRPWVEYIARSNNISAMTYAGHHPAENYAVDLALGQDGMKNTAPGIGPSGNDLYSKVASWVDQHVISAASPGWYVGTHAGIKSRGGGWHPAASQVGRRGQTFAHDDHVHVSFDPRGGVPMVGVPGNSSLPGFNWDHGGAPPKAEMPVGGGGGGGGSAGPPGNYATFSGYLGMHWTQAALEASVRKMGGNPGVAHVLGAIAMAEAMPIGKFIGNNTGMYTGAWAFQRAWAASMYDWNRLSNDLDYDSMAALRLYNAPGPGGFGATHMKWETWPGAASKFMGDGGILKMNSGGIVEGPATGIDSVPAMLSPGELVVPAPAVKQQAHRPRFQSFAAGGVVPLDFTWGGYKTTPGSGYNKATGFMKGFWSTAGNWTDMASLSKEMTALAASYKMVLSHEIRGLSNSAQFIHLSHYPAVVAVLKHMADLTKSGRLQKTAGHYTLNGKRIPGMAMGGVAGDGLAQLHAGEYVVSAPAARRYGPLLTSINAKRGSAAPSIYSPSTASSAGSGSAAPTVTHNWTVAVAPDAKPRTVARELAWEFAGARGA
jgi:hypothetical protein